MSRRQWFHESNAPTTSRKPISTVLLSLSYRVIISSTYWRFVSVAALLLVKKFGKQQLFLANPFKDLANRKREIDLGSVLLGAFVTGGTITRHHSSIAWAVWREGSSTWASKETMWALKALNIVNRPCLGVTTVVHWQCWIFLQSEMTVYYLLFLWTQ